MFFKIVFLLIILCVFSSYANAKSPEKFKIDNGSLVYGYDSLDVPKQLQKEECDKYVFADENFSLLQDGRYIAEGKSIIMVDGSCLFTRIGEAKLSNGNLIEFYQVDTFNANGSAVYINRNGNYKRIYNEKMQLKNGKRFSIKNGYLFDVDGDDEKDDLILVGFDGNDFVYEDRN